MSISFHLAIPVTDLKETRRFYGDLLGCAEGRSAERWVDFDFFGHQISAHLADRPPEHHNPVDGDGIPIPHFGVILSLQSFHDLAAKLQRAGSEFLIPPKTRFAGEIGEQATMFVRDPSGNVLEFKAFADRSGVFEK